MTDVSQNNVDVRIGNYTAGDGLELKYRQWAGKSAGDALIYLHGIESHSEWFSWCAGRIAAAGATVFALDRRGSGLSEGTRGDSPGHLRFMDDVVRFAESVKASYSRLHCAALSWGGKLAVATNMLNPGVFETITLIAPGIFPRVMPPITERLAIAFDALFRPGTLHSIPIEDEMFTSIAQHLDYIKNDPLRLREVTARFYLESTKLDRYLKKKGYQWSAPTQLLLAEHDDIVDNRRLGAMFESLRMKTKKVKMYSGCKHSLVFEGPAEVADDISDWMRTARS